jgi:hypothetical protein
MKNITKKISLLVFTGLLLCASGAFGQTILSFTTLSSAAYKGIRGNNLTVGSVSNIVAGSDLYIDQELMSVVSVPATGTTIYVIRGYGGTAAQYHASGALAWIIPAAAQPYALIGPDAGQAPSGACTRGAASSTNGSANSQSTLYLPIFDTRTGIVYDCLGGVFQAGDNLPSNLTPYRVLAPNSGATAYTSTGTATTEASAELYCTEADLSFNKLLTGIAVLNGGTVGTDKHLVALYDASGNLLANSAVAGATTSGANTYQTFAFTTQYFAIGPAQYFACVQSNGTTDNIRMLVTGTQDTYLTKGITGGTFGTVPATITVPTSFTTAVGPYQFLY